MREGVKYPYMTRRRGLEGVREQDMNKIYNCGDILKEYFTPEEIKEAGKVMYACGCSVCRIRYLIDKFPKRVPKEKLHCFGT